jgi:hypothetical protein
MVGAMAGAGVMNRRGRLDRAALVLGAVSLVSAAFVFVRGDFQFVRIRSAAAVVALVLGLLAIGAGWLANRTLTLAAGAGFLLAAAVQLGLVAFADGGFLRGDPSTVSLWLGLGVGLVALGLASRPGTGEGEPDGRI